MITVSFIHPIDTVKTRLQVSGTGSARNYKALGLSGTVTTIAKEEGLLAFWKGIPAAWMREASYTSFRLGLYSPLKKLLGADKPESPFLLKFAAGGLSGGLGSIVGNPFDVLKTKMMASESGVGLAEAASAIHTNQGLKGFYTGMDANITRAVVNNATKMAVYDQSKKLIKETTGLSGVPLQASASFIAGFFMVAAVAPFDICRTRLMNQPADKPRIYNNIVQTLLKIVQEEGPTALWRGAVPMWARIGPTTTLQLLLFEKISALAGIRAT